MKKLLFFLLSIINICAAQDIITLKNGEDIKSKIVEVGVSEIKYKNFDDQDSPMRVVNKSEIFSIKYQSGKKEMFNEEKQTTKPEKQSGDMYAQGMKDAERFYTKKNTGAGGTMATTLVLSGLIGLIPAGICASQPPKIANLGVSNNDLLNSDSYMRGYKEQAHKMKKRKIWTFWGISCGINLVLFLALQQ